MSQIYPISKFRVLKIAKNDIFGPFEFTKIWFDVKSVWRYNDQPSTNSRLNFTFLEHSACLALHFTMFNTLDFDVRDKLDMEQILGQKHDLIIILVWAVKKGPLLPISQSERESLLYGSSGNYRFCLCPKYSNTAGHLQYSWCSSYKQHSSFLWGCTQFSGDNSIKYNYILQHRYSSDETNCVRSLKLDRSNRSLIFDRSKPKIGCSISITHRWTCSSTFNVWKMMFNKMVYDPAQRYRVLHNTVQRFTNITRWLLIVEKGIGCFVVKFSHSLCIFHNELRGMLLKCKCPHTLGENSTKSEILSLELYYAEYKSSPCLQSI